MSLFSLFSKTRKKRTTKRTTKEASPKRTTKKASPKKSTSKPPKIGQYKTLDRRIDRANMCLFSLFNIDFEFGREKDCLYFDVDDWEYYSIPKSLKDWGKFTDDVNTKRIFHGLAQYLRSGKEPTFLKAWLDTGNRRRHY